MNDVPIVRKIHIDELVDKEARHIVTLIIENHLNKSDLPLPKESSLALHIDHILKSRPDIIEKARERVNAGEDFLSGTLKELGITLEIIRPIEITL